MTKTLRGSVLFCLKEKKMRVYLLFLRPSCHPGCLQGQEASSARASDPPIFIFQTPGLPHLSCFFWNVKVFVKFYSLGGSQTSQSHALVVALRAPLDLLLGKLVRSASLRAPEDGPLFQSAPYNTRNWNCSSDCWSQRMGSKSHLALVGSWHSN